ncbi:hypothetical protein ACFV98_02580 [Streptomyces violascens]|uniref:hypothetical protein n=1 Tax=Streptomyces violascens TaxID=67381 RepID=UPI00365482F3
MTTTATATPIATAPAFARRLAERLPHRSGAAWAAEPYSAWWTTRPAARLTQAGRRGALIVVEHSWSTEFAWQLDGREPYTPDLSVESISSVGVARETLRFVLPRLDDATAATSTERHDETSRRRLVHLDLIGSALRAHGAATDTPVGVQPNSSVLRWSAGGMRYAVTLVGANPTCDVSVTGPAKAVERTLTHFLAQSWRSPRLPLRDIRTRLGRRLAAHLRQFTTVDQLDDDGLTFGESSGPFGYIAPPADPAARVRDTTPVAAELYGVGIDHLVHLAPLLAR